jgi:hypothetical protein
MSLESGSNSGEPKMESKKSKDIASGNSANSNSNIHDSERDDKNRKNELITLSRISAAISGLWDLEAILKVSINSVL